MGIDTASAVSLRRVVGLSQILIHDIIIITLTTVKQKIDSQIEDLEFAVYCTNYHCLLTEFNANHI